MPQIYDILWEEKNVSEREEVGEEIGRGALAMREFLYSFKSTYQFSEGEST